MNLSGEEALVLAKKYTDEHGGGGTKNYNKLSNKPQINGVELYGNMMPSDLGLADEESVLGIESNIESISEELDALKSDKIDKPTSADNNKFPRAKDGDVEWVEQGPQGEKGEKGEKGDKGDTGADGYSPSASVVRGEGKATITITDKNGTTSADVFDGQENAIETVKVNGEALPIQDKAVNIVLSDYAKSADVNKSLGGKVDKAEGMGLSQNSYTTTEKTKLSGIAEGANKTTVTASAETLTITIN